MSEAQIKTSRVFGKIKRSKKRIVVNEGSSRSTKTFSLFQYVIGEHLTTPGLVTTIAREKLTWIKKTLVPDFKEIMQQHFMMWVDRNWNKSELTYTFANGGVIEFIGLDDPQKLHGRKQDILWINEAVEIKKKAFTQLSIRTRRKILLDYNPSYETHWIYDSVIPRRDCEFIKSTYKDNPFLDQAIVDEIEMLEPTPENIAQGTADETSWKIYGKGERAAHRGLIFGKARVVADLPPREDWKWFCYGLDFGFTNDPTAFSLVVFAHGELWLKQVVYERGLTNIINEKNLKQRSIEQRFVENEVDKSSEIYADGAEPKSIQDLVNCGYNVMPADKGPDSVKNGIDTMLRYRLNITEDSMEAIKEKNNYKWKEDRDGNPTNEPIDMFNHFWDSVRYPVHMKLRNKSGSFAELMEQ